MSLTSPTQKIFWGANANEQDILNSSEETYDSLYSDQDSLWQKRGQKKTVDTIIQSVSGRLPYNCRQYRYLFSDFDGDIVFFNQSFLASGNCVHTNLRLNLRTQSVWSLDYDAVSDTLVLVAGNYSSTFTNLRQSNDPAQMKVSVAEKRVIFALRSKVPYGGCTLSPGSNLIIQGL
ncbi:hypothetical protein [Cognatishimia activa]|uniref:Uncharacterized protein n=1 Tax=Cognatishimia activa TaxID=1715691 RepID=A0A0N7MB74_9RHOB|nr:hypothetical protein [Cognatishimia activa]CUI43000.1 hypothetical protein TA5113_00464 [Cognatishimia activa]CUK24616.1 hypothetical protein TA5114_00401 [Cognatishimia activa]